jgi:HK97 family phage portal protein
MSRILTALGRLLPQRAHDIDGRAAKGSAVGGALIAWHEPGQPVWAPRDYAGFAREGFMQNPIVYRCVRMVAEAAASVPLLLYEGDEEIEQHPLTELMARPSPDHTTIDFLESWYGFLLVSGNAYVEAVALDGHLRELHVLRPDRMKVIPGADGWPEAFEYRAGGDCVRFAAEPVAGVRPILHTRLFHPANDHYGMSPIEAAAASIDIHNAAGAWNKALLDNAARPSGALVYAAREGTLTGEQFARLKSELELSFQGARNAGRPLLLEGGLDWKPLSLSPKDMDFVEAKHASAREIALALGVPPMLLGIPGDNTYSNYSEAQRAFWRTTVLPLVARMTKAFSAWLAPAYGGAIELRADLDQVEGLSSEREALWTRLDAATFLTRDEKRAAAGYAPLPDDAAPGGDGPAPFDSEGATFRKYSPDQPRVPAGSTGGGQWTGGGGGGGLAGSGANASGRVRVAEPDTGTRNDAGDQERYVQLAQAEEHPSYPISILEEEALGGHTIERHVNKPDEYLKARIMGNRINIPLIGGAGEKRAGSFTSLEAANRLVNATLADPINQQKIKSFVDGGFLRLLNIQYLYKDFSSPTGYEMYGPAERAPERRTTYSVAVRIRRAESLPKGYYVESAYPSNSD